MSGAKGALGIRLQSPPLEDGGDLHRLGLSEHARSILYRRLRETTPKRISGVRRQFLGPSLEEQRIRLVVAHPRADLPKCAAPGLAGGMRFGAFDGIQPNRVV